jgi:hypothetical protein
MAKYRRSKFVFCIILLTSFLLFLFFINVGCESVSRPVQYDFVQEETPGQNCKIAFLAYGAGTEINGKKSLAGHASVAIDNTDTWGFYPSTAGRFFTRRGLMRKNAEHPEIHEYVDFTVDDSLMDEIQALIRKWEQDPPSFAIPIQDCVSFIHRICDIIGLKYNPFALVPTRAVRSIRRLNDTGHVYRSDPVPVPVSN